MLGIYVDVPISSFRKGWARAYAETYRVPPPSTCYGFLLSMIGETDRMRHIGVRIAPGVIGQPEVCKSLRTCWRFKETKHPDPGIGKNKTPDYQELVCDGKFVIWLDSSEEQLQDDTLEERLRAPLRQNDWSSISRFGNLCLGESTHLVNDVRLLSSASVSREEVRVFLLEPEGLMSMPVWVDHVGTKETVMARGELLRRGLECPAQGNMPQIAPKQAQ